jgi:signal transduction histidine kinase
VRIGTRITFATALSVTVTLAVYAMFEVRGRDAARREALADEARATAMAMRTTLEELGSKAPDVDVAVLSRNLARELGRTTPWRLIIIPSDPPGTAPPLGLTPAQSRRMRALSESPQLALVEHEGGLLFYAVPLRAASERGLVVTGMLELSRPTGKLDERAQSDLWRAILLVFLIGGVATGAVWFLTRNLMTQPMSKLLRGIDDVAKGDLSHVLLSERDDEIGAVASRFNDMTFSLRESRAETQRHHEAKSSLEQRLAHTEKLATIGQIAAEIAHEVGTPLNVIAGRARAVQKKADNPEAVHKNAEIIAEQTARITKIIERLLNFARRRVGPTAPIKVNVNALTLTTMELLGAQFGAAKVKTKLVRAEGLPLVNGHPDRLQQVLLNLLLNAVQAMPDGGSLTLETSAAIRQRPGLELAPEQLYVCMEVTDNGPGIPEERREKIFEPFYTSKDGQGAPGQGGTGLGLAVCAGIVKEHDGWIEVGDSPDGGARFRVFLPC